MKFLIPVLAVACFAFAGCKSSCCGKCGGGDDASAKACPAGCDKECCKKS